MIIFGVAAYTPPVAAFGQTAGTLMLRYRLMPEGTVIQRSISGLHVPMTDVARRALIMRATGCMLLQ